MSMMIRYESYSEVKHPSTATVVAVVKVTFPSEETDTPEPDAEVGTMLVRDCLLTLLMIRFAMYAVTFAPMDTRLIATGNPNQ